MARDLREQIEDRVRQFQEKVDARHKEWSSVRTPVEVRKMELEIAAEARALADGVTEAVLRERIRDVSLQAEASVAAFSDRKFRHGGTLPCMVTLLGGSRIELGRLVYAKPNRRRAAQRRRSGHRGKGGQSRTGCPTA